MASLVRVDLNDDLQARLERRAAARGHSAAAEARSILHAALAHEPDRVDQLGTGADLLASI